MFKRSLIRVGTELKELPCLSFYFDLRDDDGEVAKQDFKKSEEWFSLLIETLNNMEDKCLREIELVFANQEFIGDSHLDKLATILLRKSELRGL
jgi:hypothetical protein